MNSDGQQGIALIDPEARREWVQETCQEAVMWRLRAESSRREGAWARATWCRRRAQRLERQLVDVLLGMMEV